MKIIREQDYNTMPWKNGLGSTREICCERIGDDFGWRLSLAKVAADGPFSKFEGLERILTVIDGKGLRVAVMKKSLTPAHFVRSGFPGIRRSLDIVRMGQSKTSI